VKPSRCGGAKCPPGNRQMCARTHRAVPGWNNTPAAPGRFRRPEPGDHSPTPGCAGSNSQGSRHADTATA
jgi:hypothetical protein